ncbi:MAG: hypothetical protein CMM47_09265 [Rhodospirillaceae bacterium]|nr:hypothetical protein [Rhodospirillaceae bacterium]
MQTSNRLFDDLAKMANGALSVAAGARQEIEQLFQQRLERFLNDRGWVTREEFEAVRDMTQKAREEQESLLTRLAMLEAEVAKSRKTTRKSKSSLQGRNETATTD